MFTIARVGNKPGQTTPAKCSFNAMGSCEYMSVRNDRGPAHETSDKYAGG